MNEQELLNIIIKEQDWEQLIYNIVTIENLDPWDIDLVKLVDSFMKYLQKVEELDFRIPAKVILIAAVLLKMKIEYLEIFRKEVPVVEEELISELERIDFSKLKKYMEEFKIPIIRRPARKITLDELVDALRKAIEVEERRRERRAIVRRRIAEEIKIEEESIEKRIERILKEIDKLMKKLKKREIPFSSIVEEWTRECIVEHFVPILHLDFRGDISCKQEELFKEIFIRKCKAS
ncbi:MAG TPA: hypothetical protein ENG45_01165 [Candidatus Aenigmarchaeota archaeon]|nr:hypothetical protein [Candidatus Aenigmarchaeota archaeon]